MREDPFEIDRQAAAEDLERARQALGQQAQVIRDLRLAIETAGMTKAGVEAEKYLMEALHAAVALSVVFAKRYRAASLAVVASTNPAVSS